MKWLFIATFVYVSQIGHGQSPGVQPDIRYPEECTSRTKAVSYKIECKDVDWGSLAGKNLPTATTQLTVTGTQITRIGFEDLSYLDSLERLDLSNNAIEFIEDGAFAKLANLTKLDLSNNRLASINGHLLKGNPLLRRLYISNNVITFITPTAFNGLQNLRYLSLSGNQLVSIPSELLTPLAELDKIDFASDRLFCDCDFEWMVDWIIETGVDILDDTICAKPAPLAGSRIKDLTKDDLHCNWPLPLHTFLISPSSPQLVYVADSLPVDCMVSTMAQVTYGAALEPINAYWMRRGARVNMVNSLRVKLQEVASNDIRKLTLTFESLTEEMEGDWVCYVEAQGVNSSKSMTLKIVSGDNQFCQNVTVTVSGKGTFRWTTTLPGVRSTISCPYGENKHAYYTCVNGKWQQLDTESCDYQSSLTNLLREEASKNSSNPVPVQTYETLLQSKPHVITHYIEIVYLAQILRTNALYLDTAGNWDWLPNAVFNVTSLLMGCSPTLLSEAERKNGSCTMLRETLHILLNNQLQNRREAQIIMDNIVAQGRTINAATFLGITCTTFRTRSKTAYVSGNVYCEDTQTPVDIVKMRMQNTDAMIHIPSTVLSSQSPVSDNVFKLHIIIYKNATLFQRIGEPAQADYVVPGAVITAVIDKTPVAGLTNKQVEFALPTLPIYQPPDVRAVYWSTSAHDWRSDGCKVSDTVSQPDRNVSVMSCDHMTSFSLYQKANIMKHDSPVLTSAVIGQLSPQIYFGASFVALCMCIIIVTYLCSYKIITLSSKLKHSLINTCVCILLLKIVFVIGVEAQKVVTCQIFGICIHYLSLCATLWITVSSWNIYNKLNKVHRPKPAPLDESNAPLPPLPMMKFYLFAWGIPVIICGITAAVKIKIYGEDGYCFVALEPGFLAFYGVVGLFVLINLILFTCICSTQHRATGEYSPETIALNPETQEVISIATKSSLADSEYKPLPQMAGVLMFLILYILMWTSAAFSIKNPFGTPASSMDVVFSYLYMVLCIIFGVYLVVFYCVVRNDTRLFWCTSCAEEETEQQLAPQSHSNINMFTRVNHHNIEDGSLSSLSGQTQPNPLMHIMQYHQNKSSVMAQSVVSGDPSVTVAPEEALSFYHNSKQKGAAQRYWERKRSSRDRMDHSVHSVGDNIHSMSPHPDMAMNYAAMKSHAKSRRDRIGSTNSEPADLRNRTFHSLSGPETSQGAAGIGSPQSAFNNYNYPERWQGSMPKNYRHAVNTKVDDVQSRALLRPYLQNPKSHKQNSKSAADVSHRVYNTNIPERSSTSQGNSSVYRPSGQSDDESERLTLISQSNHSTHQASSVRSYQSSRPAANKSPSPGTPKERQPLLTIPPPPEELPEEERLNINQSSSDNNSSHYACSGVLLGEQKVSNDGGVVSLDNSMDIPEVEERIYENAHKIIQAEPPQYENLETLRQKAASRTSRHTPTSPTQEYELPVYENLFSMNEYDTLKKSKQANKRKSLSVSPHLTREDDSYL